MPSICSELTTLTTVGWAKGCVGCVMLQNLEVWLTHCMVHMPHIGRPLFLACDCFRCSFSMFWRLNLNLTLGCLYVCASGVPYCLHSGINRGIHCPWLSQQCLVSNARMGYQHPGTGLPPYNGFGFGSRNWGISPLHEYTSVHVCSGHRWFCSWGMFGLSCFWIVRRLWNYVRMTLFGRVTGSNVCCIDFSL